MIDGKELIVSFSGGKDSTAMLHLLLEHGQTPDEVVFFDGGWEFPQMYDHLELVEKKTGIKITRLKPKGGSFDYWLYEHEYTSKKYGLIRGWRFPSYNMRWCTRLKREAILKHLKGRDIVQAIGFTIDEKRRKERQVSKKDNCYIYPLYDAGMTEQDALEYCYRLGYTWGGLYNYMPRVSCYCCYMMRMKTVFSIIEFFPDVWEEMKKKEQKINELRKNQIAPCMWKPGLTMEDIEKKYRAYKRAQEEMQNLPLLFDRD